LVLNARFVIRRLGDEVGYIGAESLGDKLMGHLTILDGIVKQGGNDQIGVLAGSLCNQRRYLQQMVDIGLLGRSLAALVDIPPRRRAPACCPVVLWQSPPATATSGFGSHQTSASIPTPNFTAVRGNALTTRV
jgi:hypothetical protein